MEKEKFYEKGLNFSCQRCSFCCGHSPGFVYLSKRDLMSLCDFFKMPVKDFVQKYCRWADYYYGDKEDNHFKDNKDNFYFVFSDL